MRPSIRSCTHSNIHSVIQSFVCACRGVVRALAARNLSADVHVHSEGDAAAFAPLVAEYRAALHLNESLLQARPL